MTSRRVLRLALLPTLVGACVLLALALAVLGASDAAWGDP